MLKEISTIAKESELLIIMASETDVKKYLAYWFQLGKKMMLKNGQETLLPQPIFLGNQYSPEFEQCWQKILNSKSGNCYFEGTDQTIEQLLTPAWEFSACVRCEMPVPIFQIGLQSPLCPCHDLMTWPNLELPLPRMPINTEEHIQQIHQRLQKMRQSNS